MTIIYKFIIFFFILFYFILFFIYYTYAGNIRKQTSIYMFVLYKLSVKSVCNITSENNTSLVIRNEYSSQRLGNYIEEKTKTG